VPRVSAWVDVKVDAKAPGLMLIGRRHVRSNNSWMHNYRSLVKGPDRTALFVHPEDAKRANVKSGDTVSLKSRVGEVHAKVEVTDAVMPGVVSLPHGFGHAAAKDTMRIAGELGGPNVNAVTDDAVLDPISGNAVLQGVPVTIEAVAAVAVS
jgi:anaerobic selenocysteine-containing dehydrogenase